MKRFFAVMLSLAVSASLMTGCGEEKDSENKVAETPAKVETSEKDVPSNVDIGAVVLGKMESVDNVHIEQEVNFKGTSEEISAARKDIILTDICEKLIYTEQNTLETNGDGDDVKKYSFAWYTEELDDKIVTYHRPETGQSWNYRESEKEDSAPQTRDLNDAISVLRLFKCNETEELEYNGVAAYCSKGIIEKENLKSKGEDFADIYSAFNYLITPMDVDGKMLTKNLLEADEINVEVVYDAKTFLPLEIKCNLLPFIQACFDSPLEPSNPSVSMEEAYRTFKFSKYDDVSVTIPDEIKANAVDITH